MEFLKNDMKYTGLKWSLIFEFILFILIMWLTKTPKIFEKYNKNPDSVIEPIIAEAIIDRKIGTKELIMSCITELIYRKNLRNIGNDAVQIVNLDNISKFEREIIELVFEGKKQIYFNEIKEIFIKNNEKTKEIYNKLISIKKSILEKIIDYSIYSEWGEEIIRLIKACSYMMFVNIFCLILGTAFDISNTIYSIMVLIFMPIILMISLVEVYSNDGKIKQKSIGRSNFAEKVWVGMGISFLILCFFCMYFNINKYFVIYIGLIILMLLNIIIFNRTKLHCFTSTGKIEYEKAFLLKSYIKDYGLMEQRDLDSVIIWDEYLAYACAFGISNKVIEKYDEKNLNLNILFQKLDTF